MGKVKTCQCLITRLDKLSRSLFVFLWTPYLFYGPVWVFWIFPKLIKRLCLLSVPILCNVVEISFITCSFSSLKKVKGILKKRRSITQVFTDVSELIYGSKPHIIINDMQTDTACIYIWKMFTKVQMCTFNQFFFLIAVLKSLNSMQIDRIKEN